MPHHPPIPPPPKPTRIFFDPFNSSSTGHQRAESRIAGSTSWRDSRTYKLANQFGDISGRGGNAHLSDLVGAGSKDWGKDGRKKNGDWEKGAPGLREEGWQDISKLMNGSRKRKSNDDLEDQKEKGIVNKRSRHTSPEEDKDKATATKSTLMPVSTSTSKPTSAAAIPSSSSSSSSAFNPNPSIPQEDFSLLPPPPFPPQIFTSLTLHLNGSTLPLISDHRLKQLFTQHGGSISLSLARRKVTHVILGSTCGGGLASTKIQKEITRVRGKGVKYVTAQWVVDCVARGVRLGEREYQPKGIERIGGAGQGKVTGKETGSGTGTGTSKRKG